MRLDKEIRQNNWHNLKLLKYFIAVQCVYER